MADLPTISGAGTLAAVGGLHAYWAGGGRWPGHDDASLAAIVVGPPGTRWPGAAATWAVTGLLATAAGLVAAAGTGHGGRVAQLGARGVSTVMLARGAGGLVLSRHRSHRFAQLDVALYSPLCLALAAICGLAARRTSTPTG